MAGVSPEDNKALLDAPISGQVSSIFEKLKRDEAPKLLPVLTEVRGFPVRVGPARGEAAGMAPTLAAGDPAWSSEMEADVRLPLLMPEGISS